jgi:hypothetical protein
MITRSIQILKNLVRLPSTIASTKKKVSEIDELKILNGQILSHINRTRVDAVIENIQNAEFKIFSQFGDDGIIDFLIDYLAIESKTFIEFGVERYTEANTRFLLLNKNWKGLIIDGSEKNINYIKQDDIYWKYDITAVHAFVTKENINELIAKNGFIEEVGLLHIDIDGNDYWIWKEISGISPVIVIVEYNSVFGYENSWTIPYSKNFYRTDYHYSNLCYGASLLSLCDLAEEKGYYFVGCNSGGNNAYFIRKDKISGLKPIGAKQGYVMSKFRESSNKDKKLTFLNGAERLEKIRGAVIYNTRTNEKQII